MSAAASGASSTIVRGYGDGLSTWTVCSESLQARVVPESGGRIDSLRSIASGHEWLWAPDPPRTLALPPPGTLFESGPLTGIDECLPTIGPLQKEGLNLPDHGEVWARPWELEGGNPCGTESLAASIRLQCLPLHFRRGLRARGRALRLEYTVTNFGTGLVPWLWSWHPLFRLPASVQVAPALFGMGVVESARGIPELSAGDRIAWSDETRGIELSRLQLGGENRWLKVFFPAPASGSISVACGERPERLTIRFSPKLMPWLGCWISRGAFAGHYHFALEPTNVRGDSWDRPWATATGAPPMLRPGASAHWWLELEAN